MLYTQTFLGFSVLTFTFFVVTLFGTAYKTSVASIWGDTNLTHLHFLPSALPPGIAPHLHLSDTVNTHTHTHTCINSLLVLGRTASTACNTDPRVILSYIPLPGVPDTSTKKILEKNLQISWQPREVTHPYHSRALSPLSPSLSVLQSILSVSLDFKLILCPTYRHLS